MIRKSLQTVLIVEDEILIALNTKLTLENQGYSVMIAYTGEKAIDLVGTRTDIDLILMDIDLGHGIDGPGTARKILEKRELPILFLSSYVEQTIVERIEDIPSYGYVVKYTGETVLLASIKIAWRIFQSTLKERQTDAELRDREESYRALVDGLPDIVARFDADGRHIIISGNVNQITGMDAENLIGKSHRELGFPERICRYWEDGLGQVFSTGMPFETEVALDIPGGPVDINWRLLPEFNDRGEVKSVLSISRDITDRKRTEARLKKNEELLSAVYSSSDMGIFVISSPRDGEFVCEGINPKLEQLLGIPAEELIGKTPGDLGQIIGDDSVGFLYSFLDECIRTKGVVTSEYEVNIGPVKGWWYVRLSPIISETTGRIEKMIGSGINITDRKRAEAEIIKERERYEGLIESTHSGTWEWDLLSGSIRFNRRLATMFGYEFQEMRPFTIKDLGGMIHPDDFEPVSGIVNEYLKSDEPYFDCEFRIRHKDDHWIWVLNRGKVITRCADGKPHMMFGTLTDISERKRNEEMIRNLLAEKETLLKEVHHRIKNNMITIEKLLSMQARSTRAATPRDAMLQAGGYVAGMRLLYEKMLQSEDYRNVSVKRYLGELLDTIGTAFPDSRRYSFETQIDDFEIAARELFPLSLIVNELVTNIMKYAFIGRENGTIGITLRKTGDQARLIVEDDGIGLPDDFTREKHGGFGLSLVNMMSLQIRGKFTMRNRNPGCGLRTIIDFPIESIHPENSADHIDASIREQVREG